LGPALLLALQAVLPSRASALQLFIESAFVHYDNAQCIVQVVNGVPKFLCPPLNYTDIPEPGAPDTCTDPCGSPACSGVGDSVGVAACTDPCGTSIVAGGSGIGRCPSVGPCAPDLAGCNLGPEPPGANALGNQYGNISNDPHIEFDQQPFANACWSSLSTFPPSTAPMPGGDTADNICNTSVFLCASIGYGNDDTTATSAVPIDTIEFDVFRYLSGTNPLSDNTPTIRTFFIDAPGTIPSNNTSSSAGTIGPFCALWDGSFNIQGAFGKTNGNFGFIAKTSTNQSGASGNIQITAQIAYPSGATFNADTYGPTGSSSGGPSLGTIVSQSPINEDVTDVHLVRSTPTLYGSISPVPGEPYNIFYQLSKDATMFITISQAPAPPNGSALIRTLVNGLPRVGEGIPTAQGAIVGPVFNGDSWNGRADNGDMFPPGVYEATLQAFNVNQFGFQDLSTPTTIELGLDPLQLTDIRVVSLSNLSTSQASLSNLLTEPATMYIDIYPPGTQFCPDSNGYPSLLEVNNPALDLNPAIGPPKNFNASLGGCTMSGPGANFVAASRVKSFVAQQNKNTPTTYIWDGRDTNGNMVPDGDYVFVMYAAMASANGYQFDCTFDPPPGCTYDTRIWTSNAKSGFVTIDRGYVGTSAISVQFSAIGSSPAVAGLPPFTFAYSLSRDAIVNLTIYDVSGVKPIRHLVVNAQRPAEGVLNTEIWSAPTDDNGLWLSSGTYTVQLTATDPNFTNEVTTTSALFPVNPYRLANIQTTPILGGASDFITVSYIPSVTALMYLNIYAPGTTVVGSSASWPPCGDPTGQPCSQVLTGGVGAPGTGQAGLVFQIKGLRLGKALITESWDGRDINGVAEPDGQYVFTLVGQSTTTPAYFMSDVIYGTLVINRGLISINPFNVVPDIPTLFASTATVTLPPYTIQYALTRQSSMTITVLTTNNPPAVVRTVISGQIRQNGVLLNEVWDGRDNLGNFLPVSGVGPSASASYLIRATAIDVSASLSYPTTAQITIAYQPLQIYDVAAAPVQLGAGAQLVYQVSEPMKTAIKIYKPGTSFDQNLNPSPPDKISLVNRIIGVQPARTQITASWSGQDLAGTLVPDGTYRYTIFGSTDPTAIDSITGNVLTPGSIVPSFVLNDLPVVRNGSEDPEGDFQRNTFVYPNPVTTPNATISIFTPYQADVVITIYNIAGSIVLQQDFGQQPPSWEGGNITYVWNRTNQAGRAVGRGIYYMVVRVNETLGGTNFLQTVKKILIP
jgi:flagellar hook assembly protein FlgD